MIDSFGWYDVYRDCGGGGRMSGKCGLGSVVVEMLAQLCDWTQQPTT
jgi:hypothetical protein